MSASCSMFVPSFPAFLRSNFGLYTDAQPPHKQHHWHEKSSLQSSGAGIMARPEGTAFVFQSDGRVEPELWSISPSAFVHGDVIRHLSPSQDHSINTGLLSVDVGNRYNYGEGWFHVLDAGASYDNSVRSSGLCNTTFDSGFNNITTGNSPSFPNIDDGLTRNMNGIISPVILAHHVDSTQYENIGDDELSLSSADYQAPSPTSFDGKNNDPVTPSTPLANNSIFRPLSSSSIPGHYPSKMESISLTRAHGPHFDDRCNFTSMSQCQNLLYGDCSTATNLMPTMPSAAEANPNGIIMFNNLTRAHGLPIKNNMLKSREEMMVPLQLNPPTCGFHIGTVQEDMETSPEPSDGDDEAQPEVSEEKKSAVMNATSNHPDRDQYLLQMREQGFSYKEIKRRGRFREAESTLRGRVRMLTKDKSERVRKPEWTSNDLHLLQRAVKRFHKNGWFAAGRDHPGRVPWKRISEWMHTRGSSYSFAPATCAKKWREVK